MADFTIKAHDRLPSIEAQLKTAGKNVDLTTATVDFVMRPADGGTLRVNDPAVIVTPATGIVRYDWKPADTATPGQYQAEWQVTWPGGKQQTFPTTSYHTIDVLADLDGE